MEFFNKADVNKIFVATNELLDSSSDEEESRNEVNGLQPGKAPSVIRKGHQLSGCCTANTSRRTQSVTSKISPAASTYLASPSTALLTRRILVTCTSRSVATASERLASHPFKRWRRPCFCWHTETVCGLRRRQGRLVGKHCARLPLPLLWYFHRRIRRRLSPRPNAGGCCAISDRVGEEVIQWHAIQRSLFEIALG